MAYQSLLDGIALVVGGTVTATPGLYAGIRQNGGAGDGTGVVGIKSCWSRQPDTLQDFPVGVVVAESYTQRAMTQGQLDQADRFVLLILLSRNDSQSQTPTAVNFRDLVDAAFLAHMQLGIGAPVVQAFPISGRYGVISYAGGTYVGWHITVEVLRHQVPVYVGP